MRKSGIDSVLSVKHNGSEKSRLNYGERVGCVEVLCCQTQRE